MTHTSKAPKSKVRHIRNVYEFKTFQRGKRKGQEYCNIRSVKTGKLLKSVSSKVKVKTAHKSAQQQVSRALDRRVKSELIFIAETRHANIGDLMKDYKKDLQEAKTKEKIRMIEGKLAGKRMRGTKPETIKKSVLSKIEKRTGHVTTFRYGIAVTDISPSGQELTPRVIARGSGTLEGMQLAKAIQHVRYVINKSLRSYTPVHQRGKAKGHPMDIDWLWHEDTRAIADFDLHPRSGICIKVIDRETSEPVGTKYQRGVGCGWDMSGSD